jgi:DNA-binding MarR family transcriptional regulator
MTRGGLKGKDEAWGVLTKLWRLMQALIDDTEPLLEELGLGLSPKSFFLLAALEEHPFPAELARLMHLPPPKVTYMLKHLESRDLIERRAEPGDLRKFRLVLTSAGKKAISQGKEAFAKVVAERISRLTPEDVCEFDRVVSILAKNQKQ